MLNYNVEKIATGDLHFDVDNPRLAEFGFSHDTPESEIFSTLWGVMGVKELVLSIVASGFFQNEPLIITKENNRWIVIEGNRRLAAVKAILDQNTWGKLGVANILLDVPEALIRELQRLPCIKANDRKEAWKYIGFKHINGPAKWGSYAKAQYISQIKKDFHVPLNEIAEQIGDTHNTVQKLYQGLMVIEQAERSRVFELSNINAPRLYFSHLYTGLGYEGIQNFLGVRGASDESESPVPENRTRELGELLSWMFGDKRNNYRPVIKSQNPDLRQLDAALRNTSATVWLRAKRDLEGAFEKSRSDKDKFQENLVNALEAIQNALSYQPAGYDGNSGDLETAEIISRSAQTLHNSMKKVSNPIA